MERLPRNGDVLYNCLQTLISKCIGKIFLYKDVFECLHIFN